MGPYGNQTAGRPVGPYAVRKPKPHVRKTAAAKPGAPKSVKATQAFLRSKGYNIAVDGVWGSQSKQALADWHKAPKDRSPGLFGDVVRNLGNVTKTLVANKGEIPSPSKKAVPAPLKTKVKAAKNVAAKTGKTGGGGSALPNIGSGNVGTMLGPGYADAVAGEQYDPTIHDLGLQRARQPVQEKQDLSDIKNFYAQVMGHQQTAASRDHAISEAGQGSVQQAVQAILGSIGGSANAGSSTVGAAGASDLGTLQALAQNNDQYNQDIAPLLAAEGAAAGTREIHAQDQSAQDIATKIQDALGARGQAKAKAMGDVTQANNALAQQRFQNRVALLNTAGVAQLAGLKTADLVSTINYRNKRTALLGKTSKNAGVPGWLGMSHGDRLAAINQSLAPYLDPNGALLTTANPNDVANKVREALRGQGFTSARKIGFRGPGINPRAQADIIALLHSQLQGAIARRPLSAAAQTQ